jgi:hypothetical protein
MEQPAYRCAPVAPDGSYRLDSLPMGAVSVSLFCEIIIGIDQRRRIKTVRVPAATPAAYQVDWSASIAGCDPRPDREVIGTFSGHYSNGFEESGFVPCPADSWVIPADSLDPGRGPAWVDWRPGHSNRAGLVWPAVPGGIGGVRRYFVTWRGTVVGPGHFGHMGASPFEFLVDSVIGVSPPAAGDCQ